MVKAQKKSHLVYLGRIFLVASFLFVLGAVFMRVTDGMGLKMNPQYLLNDAIAFSLFGIGLNVIGMRKHRHNQKRRFGVRV